MDQDNIFCSAFMLKLTNGFEERLAFDVTDCTTNFNDGDLCISSSGIPVKAAFDLVRDMWELPLHLSGVFSKQEAIPLQCRNLILISILIRER